MAYQAGEEDIDVQMGMEEPDQMGMEPDQMGPDPMGMPPQGNADAPLPMPGMPGQPQPNNPMMTGATPMQKKMVQFMSKRGKVQFMAKDAPRRMKDVFKHCMLKM